MTNKANDRQIGGDHYMTMDIEPWDVVDTWPIEQRIEYYKGNAAKCLMRLGSKDDHLQDSDEVANCMQALVEVLLENAEEYKKINN